MDAEFFWLNILLHWYTLTACSQMCHGCCVFHCTLGTPRSSAAAGPFPWAFHYLYWVAAPLEGCGEYAADTSKHAKLINKQHRTDSTLHTSAAVIPRVPLESGFFLSPVKGHANWHLSFPCPAGSRDHELPPTAGWFFENNILTPKTDITSTWPVPYLCWICDHFADVTILLWWSGTSQHNQKLQDGI